jgi:hypothetical protein
VPVPHPEDHGIDFYCTLTERIGQRSWAKASYTVQVKSEHTWLLEGKVSVDWLIKHPLPLFLGVMDKTALKLRLYHIIGHCNFHSVYHFACCPHVRTRRSWDLAKVRGTRFNISALASTPPQARITALAEISVVLTPTLAITP